MVASYGGNSVSTLRIAVWICILVAIFFLGGASSARGAVSGGPGPEGLLDYTVEGLTVDSPLIMTAKLVSERKDGSEWIWIFAPEEVLKSPSGFLAGVTFTCRMIDDPRESDTLQLPSVGDRVLLFVGVDPASPTAPGGVRDGVILGKSGPVRSILAPSVYDTTWEPIKDSDRAVSIVRAELARDPRAIETTSYLVYPLGPHLLPDDDRFVPLARQWVKSDNPLARFMGVGVLDRLKDPQDTPILQALLNDPYIADEPMALSPWSGREYVIRERAWLALRNRKAAPAPISLALPQPGLYRPACSWLMAGSSVPPAISLALCWLLRKRSPRRSILGWVATYLSTICIAYAVIAAFCWHRARQTADDIVYAHHGLMVNVASVQDNLFIEWSRAWPVETELVQAAITPNLTDRSLFNRGSNFRHRLGTGDVDNPGTLWEEYCEMRDPWCWLFDVDLAYVCEDWGVSPLGARSGIHGGLIAVAYPFLIATLLAFPVGRWLVFSGIAGIRWRNRKRRTRLGLCTHCAYDLRAHAPGQRCPECGTLVTPSPCKGTP
jgi:hypothetical protein